MKNKAILIDAKNREIREVEVDGLKDIYRELGVQLIQVGTYLANEDVVYVDEEGLYGDTSAWFVIEGGHQPFVGNGLVIGTNPRTGEDVDAVATVEDIKSKVKFLGLGEVRAMVA